MQIEMIKAERALSPTGIELADFVINPYRGCQVGCVYCYARSNKALKKIATPWGEYVHVREGLPELLEKELASGNPVGSVLVGSTTEAFQQSEEKFQLTKDVLKTLRRYKVPVTILTKMPRITECLDILDYLEQNTIYFTVNTEKVRGLFEKASEPQAERIKAIESIYRKGVKLIVYISPVFPGLTDIEEILKSLKGKTAEVNFEAYNPRLGNWNELKQLLSIDMAEMYENIFFDKANYEAYWAYFEKSTTELNQAYGYQLRFYIPPFDSWYNS